MVNNALTKLDNKTGKLGVIHLFRAPVGGLFRHVCDLVRAQCNYGLDVGIICDSTTGGAQTQSTLGSLRQVCGLGVHRLPMHRKPGLSDIQVIRAARDIIYEHSPDILHGHGAKGAAYARILAPRLAAKAIYTPHGGALHYSFATLRGGLYLTLEKLLKSRTDGLIFESAFARRTYGDNVGQVGCPYRIIHNGLYEREFELLPANSPAYDLMFIGELRNIKGIHVFLDAVSQVLQHRRISVLIAGDGDQRQSVKERVSGVEFGESVTLSPSIHPASKAFGDTQCIVVPSIAESLPYIVLECIAAGVPILSTRVGGIPEIFGPFDEQLLRPGDPDALAHAIRAVLEDLDSAKKQARALRDHVRQHFRVSQMADETTAFYRVLLGGGQVNPRSACESH